ncbi:hypothetical protein GCM10022243_63590 [Saccharothrix violaceirubra]|uniref:hypothetical protein n=1 Tax=Saccharothrix violaceirubra TaxID=413306 RepID=UPI0031F18D20
MNGPTAVESAVVASLDDQAVAFVPATLDARESCAPTATLGLSLPLERDDLVAALFACSEDPGFAVDTDDDAWTRRLIADAVLNLGLGGIAELRHDLAQLRRSDHGFARLALCRRIAERLWPTPGWAGFRRARLRALGDDTTRPGDVEPVDLDAPTTAGVRA